MDTKVVCMKEGSPRAMHALGSKIGVMSAEQKFASCEQLVRDRNSLLLEISKTIDAGRSCSELEHLLVQYDNAIKQLSGLSLKDLTEEFSRVGRQISNITKPGNEQWSVDIPLRSAFVRKALFAALLNVHCRVTDMDISKSDLGKNGECMKDLVALLQDPGNRISRLMLFQSELNDADVALLVKALMHKNCKLEYLQLFKNGLRTKSVKRLASVIQNPLCRLKRLNVSGDDIGKSGERILNKAVLSPKCSLYSLTGIDTTREVQECLELRRRNEGRTVLA